MARHPGSADAQLVSRFRWFSPEQVSSDSGMFVEARQHLLKIHDIVTLTKLVAPAELVTVPPMQTTGASQVTPTVQPSQVPEQPDMTRDIVQALIAAWVAKQLADLMLDLYLGHITTLLAVESGVSAMTMGYARALTAGSKAAAHDHGDTSEIDLSGQASAYAANQRGYLIGMTSAAQEATRTKEGMPWLPARTKLYGSTLTGAYEHGYGQTVQSAHPDYEITWKLGETEHCPLCLARDGQTFTFETLPGWPGDGGFGGPLCLGGPNCGCRLEYSEGGQVLSVGDNTQRPEAPGYYADQLRDITARRQQMQDERAAFVAGLPNEVGSDGTSARMRAQARDDLRQRLADLLNQRIRQTGGYQGVTFEPQDVPASTIASLIPQYGSIPGDIPITDLENAVNTVLASRFPELEKVGPKGYIHGWIKVGVPGTGHGSDHKGDDKYRAHEESGEVRHGDTTIGHLTKTRGGYKMQHVSGRQMEGKEKTVAEAATRLARYHQAKKLIDVATDQGHTDAGYHLVTASEALAAGHTEAATDYLGRAEKNLPPGDLRNEITRLRQSIETGSTDKRAIESELDALARHVRKGRLISSWIPRHVSNHTMARISESVSRGLSIDEAILLAKVLIRRVDENGQIYYSEDGSPDGFRIDPSANVAAGGGGQVFTAHDADGTQIGVPGGYFSATLDGTGIGQPGISKVGPKGFIHGWIYVGPDPSERSQAIQHPETGKWGQVRGGAKPNTVDIHYGNDDNHRVETHTARFDESAEPHLENNSSSHEPRAQRVSGNVSKEKLGQDLKSVQEDGKTYQRGRTLELDDGKVGSELRDRGIEADFTGMDQRTAQLFSSALARLDDKYPGVLKKVTVGKYKSTDVAQAGNGAIDFNPEHMSRRGQLESMTSVNRQSGETSTNGAMGVVTHEFGHVLASHVNLNTVPGNPSKKSLSQISKYALKNPDEAIADGFSEALLHPKDASKSSKDIMMELNRRFAEMHGSSS